MIAGKHLGKSRQYWRDIILGVNDGLVSTFLLVAGVAGAGLASKDILLTALAGALAGAISMAAGEYVATKSQNEVMRGEINLEEEHVKYNLHEELLELDDLLQKIGIKTRVSASASAGASANTAASSMRDEDEEEEKEKEQGKCVSVVDLHESMKDYYKENPDALLEL